MPRPKKEKPNHAGGLYEVKITIGKDVNGKLQRKSFYSPVSKDDAKRAAEKWKIERAAANKAGIGFVDKEIAFSDWALKWAETYKKPHVDENTYNLSYLNTIKNHLIPYFGSALLTNIQPIDIVSFYATKKALSESMLKKMQMCLNGIFLSAIENELCYKNPVKTAVFSCEREKNSKRVYTNAQIKKAEEYAADKMPEVVLLLETGVRRGELLGLKWSDLDFKKKTISINRSIADRHGGGIKINPPKWDSYRINPLSERAIRLLSTLSKDWDFVFPSETGAPQSPNTWSQKLKRFMKEMSDNTQVPALTAHELRHTYGTKLRRNGADIYTIQKVMGHKDIKMTSEIYVHNETDSLRKAMKHSL